jgi:hypothetical protein
MAKYTPVYWDVDLQMESMIESAQPILKEQNWTGKSYIFIFNGESTIHICYVHANGTITQRNHIDAKQTNDFFVAPAVREIVDQGFDADREIRVLLAGSPSRISTESSAGTFEFLDSDDMKVDTITTKKRMQELATFANRLEKNGGLRKTDGSNPGKKALDWILHAMPNDTTKRYTPEQSPEDWVIACGNCQWSFGRCNDSTYKTNHLPPGYTELSHNYIIVSDSIIHAMTKILEHEDYQNVTDFLGFEFQKFMRENALLLHEKIDTILLVTAGHSNELREANVHIVEEWQSFHRPKRLRLAAPFTYVGREFTDRCVYALPKI